MREYKSLAPYLAPDDREARLNAGTARLGGQVVEYGQSVEGRPLRAARIHSEQPNAPRLLCAANIHGPEFISGMIALSFLEELAKPGSAAEDLRKHAEVWVIPCINPDGYDRTWRQSGQGRLPEFRHNSHGVDLNRNFPIPENSRRTWLPWRGSGKPGKITFRGTHPLSEPETAALDSFFREKDFHASCNFHSFMGTLIPPHTKDRQEARVYQKLCSQFKKAQQRVRYFRLASRIFDGFTGEMEDHQHHNFGCWAICVESMTLRASYSQHIHAPSVFWRFNPRNPIAWIENDLAGMCAFFKAALSEPRPHGHAKASRA